MTDRSSALELVAEAGLRYVSDETPGNRRVRRGKGFSYQDDRGRPVSEGDREWIRSLAIPPAWTDVWICPDRDGHILATGYDQADRKQYIYHPRWEDARDEAKFERLGEFGSRLASLRRRIDTDLRRLGLERNKVVALAVAVLDRTLIRVGNRRYVDSNESYGLTTLTPEHVDLNGSRVSLAFVGKAALSTSWSSPTAASHHSWRGVRSWVVRLCSDTSPQPELARSGPGTSTTTWQKQPTAPSQPRTSAPGGRHRPWSNTWWIAGMTRVPNPDFSKQSMLRPTDSETPARYAGIPTSTRL